MAAKFVRRARPIYWWPVTVHFPSETKPGEFDKQTLQLRFEPMTSEERKAHEEKMAIEHPENGYEVDIKTLLVVTKDWADVDDEYNQPIGFSEVQLVEACQHQWFRVAAMTAYYNSLNGPLARLGN